MQFWSALWFEISRAEICFEMKQCLRSTATGTVIFFLHLSWCGARAALFGGFVFVNWDNYLPDNSISATAPRVWSDTVIFKKKKGI